MTFGAAFFVADETSGLRYRWLPHMERGRLVR